MLRKHKLTYLNQKIQPVVQELVLEFYANAYRAPGDKSTSVTELETWVCGKRIEFDWKNINIVLKCMFRESNCRFHMMKSSSRVGWPYKEMCDMLAQLGKNWQSTVKPNPSKMLVVDMNPILKALVYFMHHTLDTNLSGSDLIAERALDLYLLLKLQPVNIGRIIAGDMDEIGEYLKKSLRHDIVIMLLCQKAGVTNLDGRQMVKPTRSLNPFWLKDNTMVRVDLSARVSGIRRPRQMMQDRASH